METEKKASTGNPLAVVLWVLVASGLAYGVAMTVIKTAALFTG